MIRTGCFYADRVLLPTAYGRYPALSRRRLGVFSYVSELCAGERLRLAGYSSGTGVCARGGCSARLCGSVAALCHRLMGWPCGSVAALCHRLMAGFAFLSRRFAIGSRLSFSSLRKKRRLAIACVPVPPGRDRHSCVLAALFGYLPLSVHFGLGRFFMAIPTGARPEFAYTKRSAVIGWALLSLWICDSL